MKSKKTLSVALAWTLFCVKTITPSIETGIFEIPDPKKTTLEKKEENVEVPFRSISKQRATASFEHSKFFSDNYFYLATSAAGKAEYSLARAYRILDLTTDPISEGVEFQALAPQTTVVNSSDPCAEKTTNPVYNATFSHLSLMGGFPAAALNTENPALTSGLGTNQTIAVVTDGNEGTSVLTNKEKLRDAAGGLTTEGIIGLEGSRNYLFAAIDDFSNDNAGIGILSQGSDGLTIFDATTGEEGNKAQGVKGPATEAGSSSLSNHVAMHWDSTLQRLFVGLRVRSSVTSIVHGLLVGRLDNSKKPLLTLQSAIPTGVLTDGDNGNFIVGYNEDINARYVTIRHITTMHTSTGKSYVITAGDTPTILGTETKKRVLALPIVHQQYSNKTLTNSDNIGRITAKNNIAQDAIVGAEGDLPQKDDPEVLIGGGDAPGDITKIFAYHDTVYICTDTGIYQSSALFEKRGLTPTENGLIRGWTPWQRVMGAVETKISGADIDPNTARFWYLANTAADGDTVKITSWTEKDSALLGNLRDHLAKEFPQEKGGIHQLFNFDEETPGFDSTFSMMVATGLGKVALIQTGKNNGGFVPTKGADFAGTLLADNVAVFSGAPLSDIGPICCADVSRLGASEYLVVGGYNGVAILRKSDGLGWSNLANVKTASGGDLENYTFKKIGTFKNVHKIVCDAEFIFILTPKKLYRISINNDAFDDAGTAPLDEKTIAEPTYTNLVDCDGNDSFLDFVVSGKIGFLATTSGLYRTTNGQNITDTVASAQQWTRVITAAGYPLGPVTQLFPRSLKKGGFLLGGNLYVLAGNESTDLATIVRFDVSDTSGTPGAAIDDTTVLPITEQKEKDDAPIRDYYYPFGEFRGAIAVDGTFCYHTLSKHLGRDTLFRKINMKPLLYPIRISDRIISLELESTAYNVGIPVQNTASGAWIIPGDWGLRINE